MWFGTALFKMVRLTFEITLHNMVNGQTLTYAHAHTRTHMLPVGKDCSDRLVG